MKASIVDLRYQTKKILDAIDRNENVEIYYHGKLKAILSPAHSSRRKKIKFKDLPGVGMWQDREEMENPTEYVEKLRKPRRYGL